MKFFLALSFACVALATAAKQSSNQQVNRYTAEEAYKQLQTQPYIAFTNSDHSNAAGYYVPVPNTFYAALSSAPSDYVQQLFNQLQQYGYLPIFNYYGSLAGFYVQVPGSTKANNNNVNYYIQNFAQYGLTPVLNQQNTVVALYYTYPYNTPYTTQEAVNSAVFGYNYFVQFGSSAPQYPAYQYHQQQYQNTQTPQAH